MRPWKKIDEIINILIRGFCLILLFIGVYAAYDSYLIFDKANDQSLLRYKPNLKESADAGEDLEELSDECVAWITVDDTNIDFPVMQAKNNEKYLNVDPYGNYSLSGSIFLDSRNSADFTDEYSMVYGHHMDNKTMFGALDSFMDEDFFDTHTAGTLTTKSGKTYNIRFFAFLTVAANDKTIFSPRETTKEDVYQYVKENASIHSDNIKDIEETDKDIIALSTCKSAASLGRFVLVGTLEDSDCEKE